MIEKVLKSPHGLIGLLIVTTAVGWIITQFDEKILLDDVSTLSLLLFESITILLVIAAITAISSTARKELKESLLKIDIITFSILTVFSLVGVAMAYGSDIVLKHHGTSDVKIGKVVIGLVVTGLIYLLVERKRFNPRKMIFFLAMIGFAIGFALS